MSEERKKAEAKPKIGKKLTAEINRINLFIDVIKEHDSFYNKLTLGEHWTDLPPDSWTQEQTETFDMMHELEMKLKANFLNKLGIQS